LQQQVVMTDKQLLALIGQGDKQAFAQMMTRYLPAVIGFAQRYFPQRSDAEDIAQETFTRLWCKAPKWHDTGLSIKAWLFKVAYNLSIDQLRKYQPHYLSWSDIDTIDDQACIEKIMINKSLFEQRKTALNALPERQRTALVLCAYKGFSNKEAAAIMGIRVEALESLLARGRRILKKHYQHVCKNYQNSNGSVNDYA
jgi:RNA polymerase sigma-70 factor (ECF subfamily)